MSGASCSARAAGASSSQAEGRLVLCFFVQVIRMHAGQHRLQGPVRFRLRGTTPCGSLPTALWLLASHKV
jgi:hypothetical protein